MNIAYLGFLTGQALFLGLVIYGIYRLGKWGYKKITK